MASQEGIKQSLLRIRGILGLSQKAMADGLDIDQSMISHVEAGRKVLSDRLYRKTWDLFGAAAILKVNEHREALYETLDKFKEKKQP